jgi:hypothetical protein
MNNKFKEIAGRVGLGIRHNGIVLTKDVDAAEAFEQFAQSIVRECVGVVEGGNFLHDQAPTAMFAKECSGAIKRHFGLTQ